MFSVLSSRQGRSGVIAGAAAVLSLLACATFGYWLGKDWSGGLGGLDLKQVSTAASGSNMAVATGQISDESEGVFFLDFLTGDLQCLVYYPRQGAFGARYYTNVQAQMPGAGRNSNYLMVTGNAISARTSSNVKPANCLVYVTDVNSGMFAAYAVPWNKTAESSSQMQGGPLLFVGGGPIRNYQVAADASKKPGAAVDNSKPNPAVGAKTPKGLNPPGLNPPGLNPPGLDPADPAKPLDPKLPDPADLPDNKLNPRLKPIK